MSVPRVPRPRPAGDDDPTDRGLSPAPPEPEPHRCEAGWIDRDAARPCRICRPWLTTTERTHQ